jgi:hypothetical protein
MTRNLVSVIEGERRYQDNRWGDVESNPHTVGEWIAIAGEEISDAVKAYLNGDTEAAKGEMIQSAAVVFAMVEQHGLPDKVRDDELLKDAVAPEDVVHAIGKILASHYVLPGSPEYDVVERWHESLGRNVVV